MSGLRFGLSLSTQRRGGRGSPLSLIAEGATFVLDRYRNEYYWGGAVKAASDLTASGTGYYTSNVAWLNPAAWTLMIEWDTPVAGSFPAQSIFSIGRVASADRWVDIFLRSSGDAAAIAQPGCNYLIPGSNSTHYPPNYLPHDTDIAPMMGRRRAMWSFTAGAKPWMAADGYPVTQSSGLDTPTLALADRVNIGYRQLGGSKDRPFLGDMDSITVVAWPFAMSQAQIEAMMPRSFERTPPLHMLGDSFLNGISYLDGGGLFDRLRIDALANGYAMWSEDGVGSTSLAQQKVRFDAYPRYWNSTLCIMDGGIEDSAANAVTAIQGMVANLSHERWAYVEPHPGETQEIGQAARTSLDGKIAAIRAYCGDAHFIPTYDQILAANDGSANDLADVANGICPRSLRADGLHHNAAGRVVRSQIMYNWLRARRWI